MPDLFDTSQVRDDVAYWDALAERVASNAVRKSQGGGLAWFAQSRTSLVAASISLAAAVLIMLLPGPRASGTGLPAEWTAAVAPADDVGRALVLADGPPTIDALLLGAPSGGSR